jgi:hypothetical protein
VILCFLAVFQCYNSKTRLLGTVFKYQLYGSARLFLVYILGYLFSSIGASLILVIYYFHFKLKELSEEGIHSRMYSTTTRISWSEKKIQIGSFVVETAWPEKNSIHASRIDKKKLDNHTRIIFFIFLFKKEATRQ